MKKQGSPASIESSLAPAPSGSVGATLREARERRGLQIADASHQLRIRGSVLQAMEAGQFEKLPNGAYALGFLRSYADFLGLDRDEIARRVKAEAAALSARTELVFPQPLSEGRLPSGLVMAVSILLAGGAYGLWYTHTATDRIAIPRVEAVPAQLAPATPATQAEAATVAPQVPAPVTPPPAAAVSPAPPPPPTAEAPASPATSAPPPQIAAVSPQAAPPVAEAASQTPRQYGDNASPILIRATGDSWLQIRDPSGSVVFSRILRAGESYGAPSQPGHVLATGSAGMLDIFVDGKKAPPIGRPGFTRRDVPLDGEKLLAGTAAVDPPAPRTAQDRRNDG
jgi:cytoskeleton protein RodZ